IILVHEWSVPGKVRLAAHAVREIGNSLPDYIAGKKEYKRLDYVSRFDNIVTAWSQIQPIIKTQAPNPSIDAGISTPPEFPVPLDLCLQLDSLINDHITTRGRT